MCGQRQRGEPCLAWGLWALAPSLTPSQSGRVMSRGAQTIGSIINIQSAGRDVPREQGCWILRLSAVILEAVYITEAEAGSRCGGGTLKGIHEWASSLRRPSDWSRSVPLSDRRRPSKLHCWFSLKTIQIKSASVLPLHECCKCSENMLGPLGQKTVKTSQSPLAESLYV